MPRGDLALHRSEAWPCPAWQLQGPVSAQPLSGGLCLPPLPPAPLTGLCLTLAACPS